MQESVADEPDEEADKLEDARIGEGNELLRSRNIPEGYSVPL
jgi:hypothetical protein